jgi:hypothetical protein
MTKEFFDTNEQRNQGHIMMFAYGDFFWIRNSANFQLEKYERIFVKILFLIRWRFRISN